MSREEDQEVDDLDEELKQVLEGFLARAGNCLNAYRATLGKDERAAACALRAIYVLAHNSREMFLQYELQYEKCNPDWPRASRDAAPDTAVEYYLRVCRHDLDLNQIPEAFAALREIVERTLPIDEEEDVGMIEAPRSLTKPVPGAEEEE